MNNKRYLLVGILLCSLVLVSAVGWAANDQEQLELTANEIVIDDLNSKVTAAGDVTFKRPGLTLECNKLVGRKNLDKLEATGDVIVSQEASRLQAQRLELDSNSQVATLTGSPRLKREKSTITGDKFKVNLKTDQLEVSGNVHLEEQEQNIVADADHLQYDRAEQQMILTGNVKVVQGERNLQGPKVIVDLKNEKITAQGKTKLVVPSKQGDQNAN